MVDVSFNIEDETTPTAETTEPTHRKSVDGDLAALLGRAVKRRPAPMSKNDIQDGEPVTRTRRALEQLVLPTSHLQRERKEALPVPNAEDEVPLPLGPISFSDDITLWDQQPDEPSRSYAAFCVYRDLGPQKRSIRRAYFTYYEKDPTRATYNPTLFGTWSVKFGWVQRVKAYDQYIEQTQRKVLEGRRLNARLETAELGQSLRRTAQEALNGLQEALYEDVEVEDPVTGEVYIERRLRRVLKPSEISQLADTGVKLERLALELGGGASGSDMGVVLNLGIKIEQGASTLREEARRILSAQEAVAESTAQILEAKVIEVKDADGS